MVNLSIKWFGVWLMRDESELGHSVARPARRLTLPVALEEEAQRLLLLAVRRRRLPRHHHDLPRQVADVAWRRQDWILEVPEVMYSEAERRFWTRIVILHFGVKTSQLQDSWVNWNMARAFCDNYSGTWSQIILIFNRYRYFSRRRRAPLCRSRLRFIQFNKLVRVFSKLCKSKRDFSRIKSSQ